MKPTDVKCPRCDGTGLLPDAKAMRALRKKAGMTLGQVSSRMGISIPFLSDLERGNRRWTRDLGQRCLKAIADWKNIE